MFTFTNCDLDGELSHWHSYYIFLYLFTQTTLRGSKILHFLFKFWSCLFHHWLFLLNFSNGTTDILFMLEILVWSAYSLLLFLLDFSSIVSSLLFGGFCFTEKCRTTEISYYIYCRLFCNNVIILLFFNASYRCFGVVTSVTFQPWCRCKSQ